MAPDLQGAALGVVVYWSFAALLVSCSGGVPVGSSEQATEPTRQAAPADGTVSVRVVARDVVDPEVATPLDGCEPGPAETVVVDAEGNLSEAAVWVDDAANMASDASVRLSNCRFDPRVVVLPPGSELTVRNDDPIEHPLSVGDQADTEESDSEEQDPLASGEARTVDLPDADVAVVRIGPQPWEQVLVVRASRGVVTDEGGRGVLSGLPPGQHTVHVLHPLLGRRDAELSVTAGKSTMLEVLYRGQ